MGDNERLRVEATAAVAVLEQLQQRREQQRLRGIEIDQDDDDAFAHARDEVERTRVALLNAGGGGRRAITAMPAISNTPEHDRTTKKVDKLRALSLDAFNSMPILWDGIVPKTGDPQTPNPSIFSSASIIDFLRYRYRMKQMRDIFKHPLTADDLAAASTHYLALRDVGSPVVAREVWPSYRDCTHRINETVPTALGVVHNFYRDVAQLGARTQEDVGWLFTQRVIDAIYMVVDIEEPPYADITSADDVSRRVYYYLKTISQDDHVVVIARALADRHGIFEYTGRVVIALIMGYAITRVADEAVNTTQQDSIVGSVLPGWRQIGIVEQPVQFPPPRGDNIDSVFRPQCIPPYRVPRHSSLRYGMPRVTLNPRPKIQRAIPRINHSAEELDNSETLVSLAERTEHISTWTRVVTINHIHPMWVDRLARMITRRCIAPYLFQVNSHRLTCLPLSTPSIASPLIVDITQCADVIVGCYYPVEKPRHYLTVRSLPCPLMFNVASPGDTLRTGAKLRANAFSVMEFDGGGFMSQLLEDVFKDGVPKLLQRDSLPKFLRERLLSYNVRGACVRQVVVQALLPASVTEEEHVHLVTYYTSMRHFRNMFIPCDRSPHRDVAHSDYVRDCKIARYNAMLANPPSDLTIPDIHAILRDIHFPIDAGHTTCEECATKLNALMGVPDLDADTGFPFCHRTCPNVEYPRTCEYSSVPGYEGYRCSSCAGQYVSAAPRIIISVNPNEIESMQNLVALVAKLRFMMCKAIVVVRPVFPSPPMTLIKRIAVLIGLSSDTPDNNAAVEFACMSVLTDLVEHITESPHIGRIKIVIGTREQPAEMLALTAADDYIAFNGTTRGVESPFAQYWHSNLPSTTYALHALILDLIIRLRQDLNGQAVYLDTLIEMINSTRYVDIDPAYGKYEDIRSIVVYFDRVGLIKFCTTTGLIFADFGHFASLAHYLPTFYDGASVAEGSRYDEAQIEFEHAIAGRDGPRRSPFQKRNELTPVKAAYLTHLISDVCAPYDVHYTRTI